MAETTALAWVLLVPALAALVVPLLRRLPLARAVTLAAMLGVLAVSTWLVLGFASGTTVRVGALPALGIETAFALDGFNVYLLLLTALLFPVVLACAWRTDEGRSLLYLCLVLALEAGLLATFLAQNLVVLFVLWEAVLIPMVLLILVFGGRERRRAAMTFFLYTMAGSILFLAAVILLGVESLHQTGRWAFDLGTLSRLVLSPGQQTFVFLGIALACAVKSPLFPFHAWLPLAYGEASTSGTALMAGVLSKMGAFGFLRLAIPLAPAAAREFAPLLQALAVASILYGALLALRQRDFRRLVAYASLSHMGYVVLGLFSFEATGIHGALFQILSHGLAVAGLFLLLGLLEQRCGPAYRNLEALASRIPRFAVVLMLFVLASLALPLTSGFTAEFMVLLGAFTQGIAAWRDQGVTAPLAAAVLASGGVVLGATYMLRFARAILYGNAARSAGSLADLGARETFALVPLLALILWIGIWPSSLMGKVDGTVVLLANPPSTGQSVAADLTRVMRSEGGVHGR